MGDERRWAMMVNNGAGEPNVARPVARRECDGCEQRRTRSRLGMVVLDCRACWCVVGMLNGLMWQRERRGGFAVWGWLGIGWLAQPVSRRDSAAWNEMAGFVPPSFCVTIRPLSIDWSRASVCAVLGACWGGACRFWVSAMQHAPCLLAPAAACKASISSLPLPPPLAHPSLSLKFSTLLAVLVPVLALLGPPWFPRSRPCLSPPLHPLLYQLLFPRQPQP